MNALAQARANLKAFQMAFEEEKAQEYAEKSAAYRAQIDVAVWEMHDNGASISAIAQEYGTKSRNTIYEIIRRKPENLAPTSPEPSERFTVADAGQREDNAPMYTVTDTESGAHVTVAIPARTGVPITSGAVDPQWKLPADERQGALDLYLSLRDPASPAREALDRYRSVTESV